MLTASSSSFFGTSTSSLIATSLPLLSFQVFQSLNGFWIPHRGIDRDMSGRFWIVGVHGYWLPTCTDDVVEPVQECERNAGRNVEDIT